MHLDLAGATRSESARSWTGCAGTRLRMSVVGSPGQAVPEAQQAEQDHSIARQGAGEAGLPKASKSTSDSANLAKSLDAGQAALGKYYQETSTTSQQAHLTEASRNYQEALAADAGNPKLITDWRLSVISAANLTRQSCTIAQPSKRTRNNSAILGDLGYSFLMQGKLTDAETFCVRRPRKIP